MSTLTEFHIMQARNERQRNSFRKKSEYLEKNFPYKGIDKTEEVVIRGKCSPAISGSEYETEHSPTAKFSTETIIPLYSKLLGTEGSNNLRLSLPKQCHM